MTTPASPRHATVEGRRALDSPTLDAFVRAHYERLVGIARLVCFDAAEAGDAVQAALEQAWRRRDSLRDQAALRGWLDRIVVREAIRLDRRRRSPLARLFGGPREIAPAMRDPTADLDPMRIDLRHAYGALPAEQRAAIALHLHFGYTVSETASIVDAPVETVRSRLRVGRERLRRALEEGAS